jgi:hypothetical protein
MTDDRIDYRRLAELYEEFDELSTRLQAFYLDAVAGFRFVARYVQAEQGKARSFVQGRDMDSETAQDERIFSYDQIFSDGFCTSEIHRATQGQAKARNVEGGSNFITLGRVCLVSFYDFWEDYLRRAVPAGAEARAGGADCKCQRLRYSAPTHPGRAGTVLPPEMRSLPDLPGRYVFPLMHAYGRNLMTVFFEPTGFDRLAAVGEESTNRWR